MYIPSTRLTMFDFVKIKQISCGRYHTLFLTVEGHVYACGLNKDGQLGIGYLRENDTAKPSSEVRLDIKNCIYEPRRVGVYLANDKSEKATKGRKEDLDKENQMGGILSKKRVSHISAWTNSACVTNEGELFMWGSGPYGDVYSPKLIDLAALLKKQDAIKVKTAHMGGSFSVIQDSENNVYCWGADNSTTFSNQGYFKEVKISKESLRTIKVPKRILKAEDGVVDIAVGGSFAVCRAEITQDTKSNKQESKQVSRQSSVEKKLSTMDLKFTDSHQKMDKMHAANDSGFMKIHKGANISFGSTPAKCRSPNPASMETSEVISPD